MISLSKTNRYDKLRLLTARICLWLSENSLGNIKKFNEAFMSFEDDNILKALYILTLEFNNPNIKYKASYVYFALSNSI